MPTGLLSLLQRLPLPAWLVRLGRSRLRRVPPARGGTLAVEEDRPADAAAPLAAPAIATPATPAEPVSPEALREAGLAWADRLWGDGFGMPGGATEVLRLASLMPLSPATTVLVVASDAGGAARAVAEARGSWVSVHADLPLLQERATARLQSLGRRAGVVSWQPREPVFRRRYHHHALVLEAMRRSPPERLIPALASGLKPHGQLVVADVVRTAAGPPSAAVERWCQLEDRFGPPPQETEVATALAAAGFDVHVAEDAGNRQRQALMEAWARVIGEVQAEGLPPSRAASAALVTEAERWLLREKLMQAGVLRAVRWHATLVKDPPAGMAW